MATQIHIYKAKDGWRWNAKRQGRIVAESGEGYTRKSSIGKSLDRFIGSILKYSYVITTEPK